jgi:hypothetical protein
MRNMEHYVVDDIIRPSACSLVILHGITNVHKLQVVIGLAMQSLAACSIISPFQMNIVV